MKSMCMEKYEPLERIAATKYNMKILRYFHLFIEIWACLSIWINRIKQYFIEYYLEIRQMATIHPSNKFRSVFFFFYFLWNHHHWAQVLCMCVWAYLMKLYYRPKLYNFHQYEQLIFALDLNCSALITSN